VRLEYDVALKHQNVQWTVSGLFARGYAVEDAMFFFGYVAFISGTPELGVPAYVEIVAPEEWQVATALPKVRGKKRVYEARDISDLRYSGTMVGRLSQQDIKVGSLEVVLSGPRSIKPGMELMGSAMRPIIQGYAKDFGGSPERKIAFFFSADPNPKIGGGETSHNTISMMLSKPPDMVDNYLWSYVVAHEVHHLWGASSDTPNEVEWFNEGFSVYGAMLGLYQSGLNSEAEFFRAIAGAYDRYLAQAGKVSLREAGQDKGRNFYVIYNGGMAVAIALDIEAKSRAGGERGGFREMMRRVYKEFGSTGKSYTYADLKRIATETSGPGAAEMFSRHVESTDVIPLGDYLAKAGLTLSTVNGRSTITRDPNATPEQHSIFPPPTRMQDGGMSRASALLQFQ
jgi:predicted metalloprotease with PDZ domain